MAIRVAMGLEDFHLFVVIFEAVEPKSPSPIFILWEIWRLEQPELQCWSLRQDHSCVRTNTSLWVSAPPSPPWQFFPALLKDAKCFLQSSNKKESFLLCLSNACQRNLLSTHDHLQAILGKELKCENHSWSCKCARSVCVKRGEEWLLRRAMNKQVLTQESGISKINLAARSKELGSRC